jgi:predicted nucleic acid-binding protein
VAMLRVFADPNTLYPFCVCCTARKKICSRCSGARDPLAEMIEVIPRSGHKSVRAVEGMCAAIREVFPESEVPRTAYEHLINEMPGADPDDWVHSAAAIAGQADVLLTRDTAGFPKRPLSRRGVRVTTADQFLYEQFSHFPDDFIRVLDNQVADLTRSRLTRDELLDHLDHPTGTPRFVKRVRRYLR